MPNEKRNFSNDFLEVISYSILNLTMLLLPLVVPTIYFKLYENIWLLGILTVLGVLVFPVIWPRTIHKIQTTENYAKRFVLPVKKPWDWVFARIEPSWVIVHLHDGRKIGGIFDKQSYVSSFPNKEQIYLEKVWKLNEQGGFESPIEGSKGIILLGQDISSVELFENK